MKKQKTPPTYNKLADKLLPPSPEDLHTASEHTIAHIARPIIEHLHDNPVDAVIAADRGGRLLALAMHASWRYRYPGQRFPTHDGRIHFVRNSRCIDMDYVRPIIEATFDRAFQGSEKKPKQLGALFVDDWIMAGTTMARFAEVAIDYGLKPKNLYTATMHGSTEYASFEILGTTNTHTAGHPSSCGSSWDGYDEILGLHYYADGGRGVTPTAAPSQVARSARIALHEHIQNYYQPFTDAVAQQGQVAS